MTLKDRGFTEEQPPARNSKTDQTRSKKISAAQWTVVSATHDFAQLLGG